MNHHNLILTIPLAILLVVLQSSCGGGSKSDNDEPGVSNPPPLDTLGATLEGNLLWGNYGGETAKLDISTRRWQKIPVIESWMEQNKDMRNIDGRNDSLTRFSNNGQFSLKVVQDCDRDVGGVLDNIIAQCIVVFDLTSQSVISDFKVSPITGSFLYEIALSDDGQYIAILDDNTYDQYRLVIFDLGGNKIGESFYSDRLVGEFVQVDALEWLPDGRLVFSYGSGIMRTTEPFSTSAKPLKIFSENQGEPVHLRVSPDGTKIAYALKTGTTLVSLESTLWVMDVDGSNAYQLVEALGNTQPEMNNPAWSQDGKWIVFQFGGVSSGVNGDNGTYVPGVPSGLLVISSDGLKEPIDYDGVANSPDDIVRISSYYKSGGDRFVNDADKLRDSFPRGRVTWVMP